MTDTYDSFRPGEEWLDTAGKPIQAHGGSVIEKDGIFYWYGENKERTTGQDDVWHWGIRCYSSTDLYNWRDEGLIIHPEETDRDHPLHFAQHVDRPHIVYDKSRDQYVCWLKNMGTDAGEQQTATVLTSPDILGPYTLVNAFVEPAGLAMGDFDIALAEGRGYLIFEHPHSEVVIADLSEDFTHTAGKTSAHYTGRSIPDTREAPAFFERSGRYYLATSGTSGYFPNPSEIAVADQVHGPWTVLGDLHPTDDSRTSFRTQISSVFRHPAKKDLYIALGDRWIPGRPAEESNQTELFRELFAGGDPAKLQSLAAKAGSDLAQTNTSLARYAWLPIRFDGETPSIEWIDEWRVDDFE